MSQRYRFLWIRITGACIFLLAATIWFCKLFLPIRLGWLQSSFLSVGQYMRQPSAPRVLTLLPGTARNNSVYLDYQTAKQTGPESVLSDKILRHTRSRVNSNPNLVWLSLTYDQESWGKRHIYPRGIQGFLKMIERQYDPASISLGLLTSSLSDYNAVINAVEPFDFAKVTVLRHPGFHVGQTGDRVRRQGDAFQTMRRSELAKLKNYLMLKVVEEEQHILWTDAHVHQLDHGIVQRMIRHVRNRPDVGIITARCQSGEIYDYDMNAWRGTRQGPHGWDVTGEEFTDGELAKQGQHHVAELIHNTSSDELIPLDTVGSTILYMRASLIWQGLNFPHQNVIGTRWGKDGWDGIESEGLCYRARNLTGGNCMVMGGKWHVKYAGK